MNANAQTRDEPWLHRFAVLTAFITFLLLGLGGLVTSHEAGMSVPDWPTSYGYNMFALPIKFWHGGAFFEHSHRLLGSLVGLMTYILILWIFGKNSRPFMRWSGIVFLAGGVASEFFFPIRWLDGVLCGATGLISYVGSFFWPRCERSNPLLCRLGVIAIVGVIAQGILGGLRVVLTEDQLGVVHGVVGQSFFILLCAIALFTSRFWVKWSTDEKMAGAGRGLRMLVLATTILIFGQLMLGATMRGQHAGLAIPDFPAAYGTIWPDTSPAAVAHYNADRMSAIAENPITAFQIILQMAHRIVALAVLILVATSAWQAWRRLGRKNPLAKLAIFWLALIVCQVGLGAATIWTNKAADVATLHLMVGALSLVTGALWCIISFGRREGAAQFAPARTSPGAFAASPAMVGNK